MILTVIPKGSHRPLFTIDAVGLKEILPYLNLMNIGRILHGPIVLWEAPPGGERS